MMKCETYNNYKLVMMKTESLEFNLGCRRERIQCCSLLCCFGVIERYLKAVAFLLIIHYFQLNLYFELNFHHRCETVSPYIRDCHYLLMLSEVPLDNSNEFLYSAKILIFLSIVFWKFNFSWLLWSRTSDSIIVL